MNEECVMPFWERANLFPNWNIPMMDKNQIYFAIRKGVWCQDWIDKWADPVTLPPLEPDLELAGAFESVQFFENCEDEIKKLFWTDVPKSRVTGIHVRRTDYENSWDHHILMGLDWYERAINYVNDTDYLVCSDDIEWCKEHFQGPQFRFSEGTTDFEDWQTLIGCDSLILSNSTFSWWTGYLSSARVVCPAKWYKYPAPLETYKYIRGWKVLP